VGQVEQALEWAKQGNASAQTMPPDTAEKKWWGEQGWRGLMIEWWMHGGCMVDEWRMNGG
jgi:hypothetical protein